MSEEIKGIDNGGPAFPSEGEGHGNPKHWTPGMNLRDWFAGQAASGMLAYVGSVNGDYHTNANTSVLAEDAYRYADAMLAARKETK